MNRRGAIGRIAALLGAGAVAPLAKLVEPQASETVGYASTGNEPRITGVLTTTGTFTASSSTSSMTAWVGGTEYKLPLYQ